MAVKVGGVEFSIRVVTGNSQKALRRMRQALGETVQRFTEGEKGAGKFEDRLKRLGTAVSFIVGAKYLRNLSNQIFEFTKNATILSARAQNLGTVLQNVGQIAGENVAQLRLLENSVKSMGITTRGARQALSQLAQANIELTKGAKLARIAQDAAVIAGIDSTQAFQRLIIAIQRNDVRLLRNLGIVINLNEIYGRFSRQVGKSVQQITLAEKRQLVLNAVMARGQLIAGTYEASLQDVFKRFTSLNRKIEEAKVLFGEQFIPVFEVVVTKTEQFLKSFSESKGLRTFVTTLGVVITSFATLGGLVAAAVGAVIAFKLAVLVVPATIPLVALIAAASVAIGAFFVATQNATTATEELDKAIDKATKTHEEFAQKVENTTKDIETLREVSSSFANGIDSNFLQVRQAALNLADTFPKLRDRINEALDAPTARVAAQRLLDLFGDALPITLDENVARLERVRKEQEKVVKRFQDLAQTALIGAGVLPERGIISQFGASSFANREERARVANEIIQESLKSSNGLREALQEILRLSTDISDEVLSEKLIAVAAEFEGLNAQANQFRLIDIEKRIDKLSKSTTELANAGEEAQKFINGLEGPSPKTLADPLTKAFRDVAAARANLLREANEADLLKFQRDLKRSEEVENREIDRIVKTARTAKDQEEQIAVVRQNATKRRVALESRLASLQQDRLNALIAGEERRNQVLEAGTKQLRIQTELLERQEKSLEFRLRGVDPRLLNLRVKFRKEVEKINKQRSQIASNQLKLIGDVEKRLKEIGGRGLDPTETLTGRVVGVAKGDVIIQDLRTLFRQLQTEYDQLGRQLVLSERDIGNQFEEVFAEQSRTRINQINRLNKEIRRIETGERDKSLEEFEKDLERRKSSVEDFISDTETAIRDRTLPGFSRLVGTVDKFKQALREATDPTQFARLGNLLKTQVEFQLEEVSKSTQRLRDQLQKLTTETIPKRERDQRIQRQREFNSLVDAGVPIFQARREIQKREFEDQKKNRAEREKLEQQLKDQEKLESGLKEEAKKAESELLVIQRERMSILAQEEETRKRLQMLAKEDLAIKKQELEIIKQRQAQNQGVAEAGLTGRLPAPTGAIPSRIPLPRIQETGNTTDGDADLGKFNAARAKNVQALIRAIGELKDLARAGVADEALLENQVQALLQQLQRESRRGKNAAKRNRVRVGN